MKENNINKHLEIAIANIEAAKEILTQEYNAKKEELEKEPKAKIEIKFGQDTSYSDNMDELIEKFSKDLEEMLNDFTEKREG